MIENQFTCKTCSACRVEKAATEFAKSKAYHDGFRPHCKECEKKERKQRWVGKGATTKECYIGATDFKPILRVDIKTGQVEEF